MEATLMAISAEQLKAQIEARNAPVILDVRSKAEYDAGHVPGALHVPFWQVSSTLPGLGISPGTPLVVYCGHGPRAYMAGSRLRRLGFASISYLSGHMWRWRQKGFPEER
jgi:rhodanese-related sulfurtransferase